MVELAEHSKGSGINAINLAPFTLFYEGLPQFMSRTNHQVVRLLSAFENSRLDPILAMRVDHESRHPVPCTRHAQPAQHVGETDPIRLCLLSRRRLQHQQ